MPDPRRVPVTHPDVKLLGRIFGFTSRTASSSMTFFLLADAARLDATHSDRDLSHLTPGFVVAAHKLMDDMLNDAIRRALMGSHERSVPTDKRTMAEALLRKSLTSGDPSRPSSVPTLTLGTDDSLESIASLFNLCEDVLGRCGPDEGLGAFVMFGEVFVDRDLQVREAFEDAAPDALAGDLGEEALDHVQPGRRGRGEMEMEAWMPLQPGDDLGMLVGAIVVHDQMEVEIGRRVGVDRAAGT